MIDEQKDTFYAEDPASKQWLIDGMCHFQFYTLVLSK